MLAGLGWREAREVSMEDLLCLLLHGQLECAISALEQEADRVASLPLADEAKQQQQLAALELRARGLLDRFYRPQREV